MAGRKTINHPKKNIFFISLPAFPFYER